MSPPTIQALGITQEWSGTSWKATGLRRGGGLAGGLGPQPGLGPGGIASPGRPAGGRAGRAGGGGPARGVVNRSDHRNRRIERWPQTRSL